MDHGIKATNRQRSMSIGAEVLAGGGVHFRVWAPRRQTVTVMLEAGASVALEAENNGYFSALVPDAGPGSQYRLRLDQDQPLYPDPASRFQPCGPHGPSQVVDPHAFVWTDEAWRGLRMPGQVLYEMHIGTFTQEGTWQAAAAELPELARLGITGVEVMPVADFPGNFGWGYDGVNLFAPTRLYGTPEEFRHFVNTAHGVGIGVILDVVYNHLGPDGNYLQPFAAEYFSTTYTTEWGDALNFDGELCGPVRDYILSNAAYWIREFHLDGLRLDATQNIYDQSEPHILTEIGRWVRQAAGGRGTIIVAENEPQEVRLVQPVERGGHGLDGLWNDDFHHSMLVAMTGRHEAYYTDYLGQPQEFISAVKYGYLYQGQWYRWQQQRRGSADLTLEPAVYVHFMQNHDQIANSGRGERCYFQAHPGVYRALTALLLLAPGTPMLFQGQEFKASSPFLYFADFPEELQRLVSAGRKQSLAQFRGLALPETQAVLSEPGDVDTFKQCKLDFSERERQAETYQMHADLLQLRRSEKAFQAQRRGGVDGAVLAEKTFLLRFFGEETADDRLLLINLGMEVNLNPSPEPLLAPPQGKGWEILWSSEDLCYGGLGTPPVETTEGWLIPGHVAIVLKPSNSREVPRVSLVHPAVEEALQKR
ncbi:MAG: malto-oligosyltrehalose trehalohydrolase [Candidatus Tectimicrobiota bacterium]